MTQSVKMKSVKCSFPILIFLNHLVIFLPWYFSPFRLESKTGIKDKLCVDHLIKSYVLNHLLEHEKDGSNFHIILPLFPTAALFNS